MRSSAWAALAGLVLLSIPTAAHAVVPPPPAIGSGTSGSVDLRPTLAPGESVTPTTGGLSPARVLRGEYAAPADRSYSGVTNEIGDILLGDQVWVENASLIRIETVVSDPSVELALEVEWIEQGDLNVGGRWRVDTPGPVERLDEFPYFGLWLVNVHQLSGPAGVAFTTTATVVSNAGSPLTFTPQTATTDASTITASWSGLAPASTYLATIDWGSPQQRSILEVRTGAPASQTTPTTTTARLSSSINRGGTTYLLTRVTSPTDAPVTGQLRLRVDGVVRSTIATTANSGQTVDLRVPTLAPGVHEVKAEFRPTDTSFAPSNSPVRRLLVLG